MVVKSTICVIYIILALLLTLEDILDNQNTEEYSILCNTTMTGDPLPLYTITVCGSVKCALMYDDLNRLMMGAASLIQLCLWLDDLPPLSCIGLPLSSASPCNINQQQLTPTVLSLLSTEATEGLHSLLQPQ